jgi:hypothetical protein
MSAPHRLRGRSAQGPISRRNGLILRLLQFRCIIDVCQFRIEGVINVLFRDIQDATGQIFHDELGEAGGGAKNRASRL